MKFAIGAAFLIFLTFAGASAPKTDDNLRPTEEPAHVTISVFNHANIRPELLTRAEEDARRIFLQAGVDTIWLNCSRPSAPGQSNAAPCGTVGPGHLVAEILPHANDESRSHLEVLGTATLTKRAEGFYCYAFYDRIELLAGEHLLLKHKLLGAVLAHEIGHLLLRSSSHSLGGLMSGRWSGDELRRVSQSAMVFQPSESRIIRQRLSTRTADPVDNQISFLSGDDRKLLSAVQ